MFLNCFCLINFTCTAGWLLVVKLTQNLPDADNWASAYVQLYGVLNYASLILLYQILNHIIYICIISLTNFEENFLVIFPTFPMQNFVPQAQLPNSVRP